MAISPQWLADAMARVVSFSSGPRVPDGILDHSTLSALWPATITDAVTGEERVLAPDPRDAAGPAGARAPIRGGAATGEQGRVLANSKSGPRCAEADQETEAPRSGVA